MSSTRLLEGDNDQLSKFLATYPTQIHYLPTPQFSSNIRVFCSQTDSSSGDDAVIVHEKIKSAFCNVSLNDGLIQFWSPLEGRQRLLATFNQPFSLEHLDSGFKRYRLSSLSTLYSIDDVNLNDNCNKPRPQVGEDEEEDIRSGGPVTAFLNHLPSFINLHITTREGKISSPQFISLYLPVFNHSVASCVGVVECSMKSCIHLVAIFKNLKSALEIVGLRTFHLQDSRPYKTIPGLKCVIDELDNALQIVHESHGLTLSQVWISYEDEKHVPFSSSSDDKKMKQKFAVKLLGHCADSDPFFIKDYHDICDIIPLIMGDGITGRTLQSHESHFCRDIDELTDSGLLAVIPDPFNTDCSCFAICLRSIDTGDVDYVFEFLWPLTRNYYILLESLLLTLKRCLPSFKLASGAQLGDKLRVLDVENSTGSGTGFFKILHVNRLSQLPKALDEGRRLVIQDCISSSNLKCNTTPIPLPQEDGNQQFGHTLKETAQNVTPRKSNVLGISELPGPTFAKRELYGLSDWKVESNQECKRAKRAYSDSSDSETSPYNAELVIAAEFKDKISLFHIPSSSKLADVLKKVEHKFNFVNKTYRLRYFLHNTMWIDLVDEADWLTCMKIMRYHKLTDLQVRVESTA